MPAAEKYPAPTPDELSVYLADAGPEERPALRWLLQDLGLEVAGEAGDWPTALAEAARLRPGMLLVDLSLLPRPAGPALTALRSACPALVIVLLAEHAEAIRQAALAHAVDLVISKDDPPERVAERLRQAAGARRGPG